MKVLLIRFDAPLVSFGGPMVDQNGVVQPFPGLSMLTGLLANALGWDRRAHERLSELQDRLRFAARIDRRGEALLDYQTVDLGADWMRPEAAGWTTRGRIAERGGASGERTHQRYRHYRADSVHTVAVTLDDRADPSISEFARVLEEPARPLFIGRKCCLPATPLLLSVVSAESMVSAIAEAPRARRADHGPLSAAWWDGDDSSAAVGESRPFAVSDERDWRSGVAVGRRIMREGRVDPPDAARA